MNSARDLIGRRFQDKFVITDVLGEGSMGIVYRGFDDATLDEVAIKVLQPSLAQHDDLVVRFHREAAAARRVDHEGAVRVLGRGCEQGLYYFVMELLHGKSLGAVLAEHRRLSEARAARVVVELMGALAVAHARGVVHRDIKPDNIMIVPRVDGLGERVKLLDFGIAKRVMVADRVEDSFSTGEDATRHGALIGTPEYMAPEQCMAREVDPRTDVYSCGVLLYRMVTGQVPFEGAHPFELCQRHIGEDPRPPRDLAPWISPAMEAIILKAMSKAPDARHQSAAELRDELVAVVAAIEAREVAPTARVPLDSLVDPDLVAEVSVDLAATFPVHGPPATPHRPELRSFVDEVAEVAGPLPALGRDEDEPRTLILDDDEAPESDRARIVPIASAPIFALPPALIDDRITQVPSTRSTGPAGGWRSYLPTLAVAAVVGAGLASLFMVLAPLVER